MKRVIQIAAENFRYPVVVTDGRCALPREIATRLKNCHCICVTQAPVARHWQKKIHAALRPHTSRVDWIVIPNGERAKSLAIAASLYKKLNRLGADRNTILIAVGGGVVGDVTGHVAATYLRGLYWMIFATTLLSQVDSSIGGKVGVDLPNGKNLVGAIYQPRAVWSHVPWLKTLTPRVFRQGLAECIKYACIRDPRLFRLAEADIFGVVCECVAIKAEFVRRDVQDRRGIRVLLNFGHTVGHAIEVLGKFRRFWHGEAVALGMVAVTILAVGRGWTSQSLLLQLEQALEHAQLPTRLPRFSRVQWQRALSQDKKRSGKTVQVVVADRPGHAVTRPLTIHQLAEFLCTPNF